MSIKNIIHDSSEEMAREKHVPDMVIDGEVVHMKCGKEIEHPSTEKHYIGWIKLYGVTEQGLHLELGSSTLTPGLGAPVASFKVVNLAQYKALIGVSYCNLHGIWENRVELK